MKLMTQKKKLGRPKKPDGAVASTTSIRLRPDMRAALDALCVHNESELVEEIRIAIRERLERLGRWPHKLAE